MPVPDARVELQIDGTWTDVTAYVAQPTGIQLSRGRSDEGRVVDPGAGSLTLLSPDGLFSNRNPNSQYYGKLPRNTPVRISTGAGETFMRINDSVDDRASTPDHASLDITGDIDIRFDARLDDWAPQDQTFLMGKWAGSPNQTWYLVIGTGVMALNWSSTGSDLFQRVSTRLPAGPGRRLAVRVTVDVNNGAGGHTTTFYTAPTIAGPWTQLGPAQTVAGTTSFFTNATALQVGDLAGFAFLAPVGEIYAAEVRSGIGGTIVANPNFSAQAAGTTSFVDSTGKTWTLQSQATISDRRTRVIHAVPHWPSHWHKSGHDVRASLATAGILGRLGQGRKALASTLRRRIPSYGPLAYWPLEDADGATQAYSPIDGVTPMRVTGFTFAQDDTLAGSDPLPAVTSSGTMRGTVPAQTSGTGWMVEMIYNVSAAPGSDQEFFSWRGDGTIKRWRLLMRSGIATVQGFDFENIAQVSQTISIGADLFQGWNRLQFRVYPQSPGTLNWTVTWYNIGGLAGQFTSTTPADPGKVTQVNTTFGTLSDLRVGHVSVFPFDNGDDAAAPYDGADDGFTGETAVARLERLADEEAQTVTLAVFEGDTSRTSEQLGPQRPKKLMDLLQEAAEVDGGVLYEDAQRLALIYRDRKSMENQAPALELDYAAKDVAPPFEPTEDDTRLRNDITVSREGGSSARVMLETGPLSIDEAGLYDEAVTLSLYEDDQAQQIAAWRLHIATWDEARYPTVRIMLHHRPSLIPAVTALQVGDLVRITNTPSTMPPGPVDLIVQRIDDDMKTKTWDVRLTCSPAGPWTVGVVDDADLGRVDTDGAELASGVTSTATTLSVATTGLWTTAGADVPFSVTVGGEEMTVTAISGASSPQTFTVTRSVNGIVKAHSAGADLELTTPMIVAL